MYKYILLGVAVLTFISSCGRVSSNCVVAPYGITSWWTSAHATSAQALDWIGSNPASLFNGLLGDGFGFSENGGYLQIPHSTSLISTNRFTILGKVKINSSALTLTQSLFTKSSSLAGMTTFDAYDAGTTQGLDTKGYTGIIFDGRYMYFAQEANASGSNGIILRYDTSASFSQSDSWSAYDASNTEGLPTKKYLGGTFDGRYVYFAPNLSAGSSDVLRLDTQGDFTNSGSWSSTNTAGIEGFSGGLFIGAIYDGRYVYFVPSSSTTVLRYDSLGRFKQSSYWSAFTLSSINGLSPNGFGGASFDGRYLYFAPINGIAVRYDIQQEFKASSSWVAYDASSTNGLNPSSYFGVVYDGRYNYYVPFVNASPYAVFLRQDTAADFTSSGAWTAYDAANTGGLNTLDYIGGAFDGRYVYFSPQKNPGTHGIVLRLDTVTDFTSSSSWVSFDAGNTSGLTNTKGFVGASFDGRYVYFSPKNSGGVSGRVLRYDTSGSQSSFDLKTGLSSSDGIGNSTLGPSFQITTSSGRFQVSSPRVLSTESWHFLAGVYDGFQIHLYVDGVLVGSRAASGALNLNTDDLLLGKWGSTSFRGKLDDVQIYNRDLSGSVIQNMATYGFCK